MKIGILRETLRKNDERVAITPLHAQKLIKFYPSLEIVIQPSEIRCFSDKEYIECGVTLQEDLTDCDLLVGVKEVDIQKVIAGKKYIFFAHVAKMQSAQKSYFKALSEKKITLIDYEYFTNENGKRLTCFGFWAGIIGAYNAIQALGKKLKLYDLPNAIDVHDKNSLFNLLKTIKIPTVKFIITGNGHTAKGVKSTLESINIQKVDSSQINKEFRAPVYIVLEPMDYIKHKTGGVFTKSDYYKKPENYFSTFENLTHHADVYIPCHYWEKGFPIYLNNESYKRNPLRLKVIADISCDLNEPIASSIKETTHQEPFFDYNADLKSCVAPFSADGQVTMMTIPNLPAALPRDSSTDFSDAFCTQVIPQFMKQESKMINRATILSKGKLTKHFSYLYDFLNK